MFSSPPLKPTNSRYSFIDAKLNKQLQEGYSYKNLQHKLKFCLYVQNGLTNTPHTSQSLPQHTSHVGFSNVNSTIRILFKSRFHFCHDVIHNQLHPGTREGSVQDGLQLHGEDSWLQHKGLVCGYQSGKVSTVIRYYENFRATKFNNPPCLYNVISTSFSNEAITLNVFPELVCKQTTTSQW